MSIGYIVIMIRFIIIFTTRVKRFLHYFLRIVRVYPIDTANNPLHERETAQPSIRPGTRSRTTGAAIAAMSAQPYSRVFTWDAQPYHLGAAITATSAQPCSRVFTWDAQPYYLGAAITATSAQPCSRVFALGRTAVPPGRSYHRYERAATQPSIHLGHTAAPPGRLLSPPRARSHAAEYSPWDAQPYRLGAAYPLPGAAQK